TTLPAGKAVLLQFSVQGVKRTVAQLQEQLLEVIDIVAKADEEAAGMLPMPAAMGCHVRPAAECSAAVEKLIAKKLQPAAPASRPVSVSRRKRGPQRREAGSQDQEAAGPSNNPAPRSLANLPDIVGKRIELLYEYTDGEQWEEGVVQRELPSSTHRQDILDRKFEVAFDNYPGELHAVDLYKDYLGSTLNVLSEY
ncbi:hypothetical protein BOX15_Mlig003172g2, partial [Macrostomum lignano]